MTNDRRLLVVDDDQSVLLLLSALFAKEGFEVVTARDGAQASELFRAHCPDAVLMDIRMPGVDGLQAMEAIRGIQRDATVVFMTAYAEVETAVKAMRLGAFDYVLKPFDLDEILLVVKRALQVRQMRTDLNLLHRELSESYRVDRILTCSPKMEELLQVVARIAKSHASVLITGESGSGKELMAAAIHYNSPRCQGPFVKTNCAAIPDGLLESEFFGHEKGAFTGAVGRRRGRFEQAHGGTLFLDEIGDVSPALQAKLLRVLQEREFQRVGSDEAVRVDLRVIAATNRDLAAMVRAGAFREDLYYRLNVVNLRVPALRERPEDVRLLAEHFLQRNAADSGREVVGFDEHALAALQSYSWPGNVRELANTVESAVIMSTGNVILVDDLPAHVLREDVASPVANADLEHGKSSHQLRPLLKQYERQVIVQALERNGDNRAKTARELGISRRALLYKIQEHDIR